MKQITVDLHGMEVLEAEAYMNSLLKKLSKDVDEIVVIHGFNNGNRLANWLRKKYSNKKIAQKILTMNNGVTILKIRN